MKKNESIVRKKNFSVRINNDEFSCLQNLLKISTEMTLSNYIRKVALHKPITVIYRNGSADALLEEIIHLRKQLNAIGHNYASAVVILRTLEKIPEFRNWLQENESTRLQLLAQIEQISVKINQIYQRWSQR